MPTLREQKWCNYLTKALSGYDSPMISCISECLLGKSINSFFSWTIFSGMFAQQTSFKDRDNVFLWRHGQICLLSRIKNYNVSLQGTVGQICQPLIMDQSFPQSFSPIMQLTACACITLSSWQHSMRTGAQEPGINANTLISCYCLDYTLSFVSDPRDRCLLPPAMKSGQPKLLTCK